MNVLYNRIKEVADERQESLASIERALDFSNGIISTWKKGKASSDKVAAVASYLNVSTDYLLGLTTTRTAKDTSSNPVDLDTALSDEGMAMFDGKPLSEEYKKALLAMLRANKNSGE